MSRRTLPRRPGRRCSRPPLTLARRPRRPTPTRRAPRGRRSPARRASQLYAAVGADAFAELTNNVVTAYNAQTPAPTNLLASYDAINPVTGAAGENIVTKPGCSVARPNGANAGITAITLNQKSDVGTGGDGTSYCIDWVRSSRAKGTAAAEASPDVLRAEPRRRVATR